MDFLVGYQYMSGDPRLIEQIVCELKSQGIFDKFRKECLADVDTKPAYQNLRQRVEASVSGFLNSQKWKPEMNKNQLREKLRKIMQESGFLEVGVERIVDQVVNPKISTVFLPQVEDVVYKYLGIQRPHKESSENLDGHLEICTNLLPNDLEAISPDSVNSTRLAKNSSADISNSSKLFSENEDVTLKDLKLEEYESPPFEPIVEKTLYCQENSNDSHFSGISGLTSQGSKESPNNDVELNIDYSNYDSHLSRISSGSRLSIITNSDNSQMTIADDITFKELSKQKVVNIPSKININSTKAFISENKPESTKSIEQNVELKMDLDSCMSYDSDAKEMVIVTESSNDAIEDKQGLDSLICATSKISDVSTGNESNEDVAPIAGSVLYKKGTKIKSVLLDTKVLDSPGIIENSYPCKLDKSCQKIKHLNDSKHISKNHTEQYKDHQGEKSKKVADGKKSKNKSKDSNQLNKEKVHIDSYRKRTNKYKNVSVKYAKLVCKSEISKNNKKSIYGKGIELDKTIKPDINEHVTRSHKTEKEKFRKKSKLQDDHNSAKTKISNHRRSTDRDSNDGNNSSSKNTMSSSLEPNFIKQKDLTEETLENKNHNESATSEICGASQVFLKNDIDVGQVDNQIKTPQQCCNSCTLQTSCPIKIRKPKIASNIFEARKLIKVRRKIERRMQRHNIKQRRTEKHMLLFNNRPTDCGIEIDSQDTKNEISVKICDEHSKKSSLQDSSKFFGFADDHKVFYDSNFGNAKMLLYNDAGTPAEQKINFPLHSPDQSTLEKASWLSQKDEPIDEHNTNKTSKAEIMEIIFGGSMMLQDKECYLNTRNGNKGYEVSYCSDYDDDEELCKSDKYLCCSTLRELARDSEKLSNCSNNNICKEKRNGNSRIQTQNLIPNDDHNLFPNSTENESNGVKNYVKLKSSCAALANANNPAENSADSNVECSATVKTQPSKCRLSRSIYSTQCYSNDDLYKPRPSTGTTRRRKVSVLFT